MNNENLKNAHLKLIAFMEEEGYSKDYVTQVRREINHILAHAESNNWKSYSDVYRDYAQRSNSAYYLNTKRRLLG
jgi:hypothetical protein